MLGLQQRPRLLTKRPSLLELITRKSLNDLSDLRYLHPHLGLPELLEDIEDLHQSSTSSFFAFPTPIQTLHSTARTIRMPSNESGGDDDGQHGAIFSISGPVIVAENMIGVAMYELCKVGLQELVGEVIRIEADRATIQVYEETGKCYPKWTGSFS